MKKSSRGNPWHDAMGRFCHGPEARVDTWGKPISDKQRQEAVIISEKTKEEYQIQTQQRKNNYSWKQANKEIKQIVEGSQKTKEYIKKYLKDNPEIENEKEKYSDVMGKVISFQENNPNAECGTYSALTGELVETEGFSVTFHQNHSIKKPYDSYTAEDYAYMCAISKKELGSDDVYIGYFGNAEVSFVCKDKRKAMLFAIEHNQHSIYDSTADNEEDALIINPYYNPKLNPIEDV